MSTWNSYLQPYELKYNIPRGLLGALIRGESGGDPNARSPVGALGLGQLMPATARSLGVNPLDPIQNLRGAAMYLSQQLKAFGNDPRKALAAYNAGPGAVKKYNGIPPYKETQTYIDRVLGYWKESPHYGQPQGLSGALVGSQAPVKAPVQIGMPTRKIVPGSDSGSLAKIQALYAEDPAWGGAIVNNRLNKQADLDEQYGRQVNTVQMQNARAQQRYQTQTLANDVSAQQNALNAYQPGALLDSATAGGKGFFRTPNGFVRNRMANEQGWQFLQRLGTKGFGLLNDPGNTQTTGGRHSANSLHDHGRAIDFGDAKNDWTKLNSWYNYLNARKKIIGIVQLLNEGDHIHAGLSS